jgi:hypothetical protein
MTAPFSSWLAACPEKIHQRSRPRLCHPPDHGMRLPAGRGAAATVQAHRPVAHFEARTPWDLSTQDTTLAQIKRQTPYTMNRGLPGQLPGRSPRSPQPTIFMKAGSRQASGLKPGAWPGDIGRRADAAPPGATSRHQVRVEALPTAQACLPLS